eukprot:764091-Hanusia_phi.AAC.26
MNQMIDPFQIIGRDSNIAVTKIQFGSLFQSALRVDVEGNQKTTSKTIVQAIGKSNYSSKLFTILIGWKNE